MEIINIVILAAMAFISANTDGMIIAIAYMMDPTYDSKNILFGQMLGFWLLTIVSFTLAQSLFFIPRESANWLGIIPILYGITKFIKPASIDDITLAHARLAGQQIREMTILTVATGADDVIAYTPIFVTLKPHGILILFCIYTIMTVIWWMVAKWLANHRLMREVFFKRGPVLIPFLMIAIGVLIISGD